MSAAVSTVAALGLTGLAGTAPAQTTQNGLVNVSLENTTVQIPVSVDANVCDVNVAALARLIAIEPTTCDATSSSGATVPLTVGGAGPTTQTGLVNVALTNTTIQVPISAAANICGVDVAVLAVLASPTGASCTATSHSNARG